MSYPNKNKWFTREARKMVLNAFYASDYSVADIAKRTNINYNSLNKYLSGVTDIRTGDFLALCLVLKIDLSRFNNKN